MDHFSGAVWGWVGYSDVSGRDFLSVSTGNEDLHGWVDWEVHSVLHEHDQKLSSR